jgi:acetoin utilization deacetylase AcuC-like enzyme
LTSRPARVKNGNDIATGAKVAVPNPMTTLLITQPNGRDHLMPSTEPERPERLDAIDRALEAPRFDKLMRKTAEIGDLEFSGLVHAPGYLDRIRDKRPAEGFGQLDNDTFLSPKSLDVAATAVGGALGALREVMTGVADNAFCSIRPPGHHAERNRAMGFCLFNNAAIVARYAQQNYDLERVAIIDFDVHHGNGTQDIFFRDESVFYASTHQMPLYPGSGYPMETGVGNIVNAPLSANTDGDAMREAYEDVVFPALKNFHPDLIIISAGFDADYRDPLADLGWKPADYSWLTGKLMDIADARCENRIVSLLEGGYDLDGLSEGVAAHVSMLLQGAA